MEKMIRYGAYTVEAGDGDLPYIVKSAAGEEILQTNSCYYAHLYALERYCDARMRKIALLCGMEEPCKIKVHFQGGKK